MIKSTLKKYFETLAYFFTHLRYRIVVVFLFSLLIGVLDGLGLSMFLPLLKMVNEDGSNNSEDLGKLEFLVDWMNYIGLPFTLMTVLLFLAFFFFAKGTVKYIAGVYKINILNWFIKNIRYKYLNGLNNLSYQYFVKTDIGRIQNTFTGEVAKVAQSFKNYFDALQYIILVIVYMGFAFFIDLQFAILVSIGGILTNFLFNRLYKATKNASRRLTGENSEFQSLIIQEIASFKYLKATGSLRKYSSKLKDSVFRIEVTNKKIGQLDTIMASAREPILITVVIAVIYIQTALLDSPLAPILISLLFFYRALTYLMQMQFRYNQFLAVSGSLDNTQLFEKELKDNREKMGKLLITEPIERLELTEASFGYFEQKVLRELSLSIKQKETLAFVGESGSGKTTLVNILAGLLPLEKGSYKINNIDIKDINIESLQKKIGYITQDPVIFNDTVFNNVTFWDTKTEKNLEKFKNAIKQSAIIDYVASLPNKEEEVLGSNGVNLSGGQRQRISIARELYKEAEILILDEATSALDSETEKVIQENIDDLKGNYTFLIVAHRISTIKNADRIVIMEQGKIKNEGSFQELINKSSYFKKLVELQEL